MTKQEFIEYLANNLAYEEIEMADAEAKAYAKGFKEGLEARKQGEWIDENNNIVNLDKDGYTKGWCKCSKCGDYLSASDEYAVRGFFCPNCGARMAKK